MCLFGPKNWGFGEFHPLNISGYHRDSQKALPCAEPRILTSDVPDSQFLLSGQSRIVEARGRAGAEYSAGYPAE